MRIALYKRSFSLTARYDSFKYRSDKRWRALQRICLWILAKIGANETQAMVTFTTIDEQRVLDLAKAHMSELYSAGLHPRTIMLGRTWS